MTVILIGALIGFMTGGPFGAILGAFVGSWISKNILGGQGGPSRFGASAAYRQKAQTAFFRATFLVMGRIAKADGRVSEYEIEAAQAIMNNMRLSESQRQMAIELFNEGKKPSSDIEGALQDFRQVAGANTLIPMFLEIQLAAAYADGSLSPSEQAVFRQVCAILGVGSFAFDQIHRRFIAQREYYQQRSYQSGSAQHPSGMSLKQAYDVLGVSESASDSEVKRAYRKLMSEHHPDKLVAKGLPEEMMEVAKEKTQEIQGAYDQIRVARKK
ncbi:co-chaperone DjlA [uncultured Endozoicomonas sp.]|uniref:co-chaperone DjlA n=1 Tax=uncultured Endozoicomonas sp. TaxID=432652 RepID=UPI00262E8E20|nr:co-chaperone DjlA [uncultured Endozoicomonas sp.]